MNAPNNPGMQFFGNQGANGNNKPLDRFSNNSNRLNTGQVNNNRGALPSDRLNQGRFGLGNALNAG